MFAENRQSRIYELVQSRGAVMTAELVSEFGVSVETIRRDLLHMEQQGLIKRVHGGAVGSKSMEKFASLKERNMEYISEKQELSRNAAKFVKEEDTLYIDSGSTAKIFAEILKERFSSLTVITHSLDVFNILCYAKSFNVILCGGYFIREENAFCGSPTLDTLDKLHVNKLFMFPSAVSLEFGICDFQKDIYMVQRAALNHADEVYILADNSKFEKKALLKLDDMKKEYHYITDGGLPEGLVRLYRDNEINIYSGE